MSQLPKVGVCRLFLESRAQSSYKKRGYRDKLSKSFDVRKISISFTYLSDQN